MYANGDTVTISRGKHRGPATVISEADSAGQYAVRTKDGLVTVVKADNLKAPMESTIGENKLAAEIQTAAQDAADVVNASGVYDVLQALVSRLSGDMPGLGARISWPAESAGE
jgi:hypothetical protein